MKTFLRSAVAPRNAVLIAMAMAGFAGGCGGSGLSVNPGGVTGIITNVSVSPSSIQLALTDPSTPPVCSVIASALDNNGNVLSSAMLAFSSSSPAVAAVRPGPGNTAAIQGIAPGTTAVTITDPNGSASGQASVSVLANGVLDVVNGASTSDGSLAVVRNALLPTAGSGSPALSSSTLSGVSGGTVSLNVNAAIPLSNILIGIPGQTGYLDIPVSGTPGRPVFSGFNVTMNIVPNLCQQQFGVSIVLEDAAGNFTRPALVTVNLASTGTRAARRK